MAIFSALIDSNLLKHKYTAGERKYLKLSNYDFYPASISWNIKHIQFIRITYYWDIRFITANYDTEVWLKE